MSALFFVLPALGPGAGTRTRGERPGPAVHA